MNYSKQMFEMLGVEPNEEFKIESLNGLYRINEQLHIEIQHRSKWRYTCVDIADVLNGRFIIIKIPRPTEKEQLAIDYAKASGFRWIAKDPDNSVYFFKNKPIKQDKVGWATYSNENSRCFLPISFIHWEDDEPYYIGGKENEN